MKPNTDNFPDLTERFLTEAINVLSEWAEVGELEDIEPREQRMSWQAFIDDSYVSWQDLSSGVHLEEDGTLNFPEDPPLKPIAIVELPDSKITAHMYMHNVMCVKFSDGVFKVVRLD